MTQTIKTDREFFDEIPETVVFELPDGETVEYTKESMKHHTVHESGGEQ